MDAVPKKNALFRAKVKAQAQKKRIESPLVCYNDDGLPVCRVCNIRLKSDSLWPAHQASSKHHEAIENLKAKASRQNSVNNRKPDPTKELSRGKPDSSTKLHDSQQTRSSESQTLLKESANLQKSRPSSSLPADFFDGPDSKRPKTGSDGPMPALVADKEEVDSAGKLPGLSAVEMRRDEIRSGKELGSVEYGPDSATGKTKGALPEGFFDNKDADLRARGIEPVKLDVKDEYKEFEKLIREDLQEVDNRFEEEEIDAAEKIEEEETVEQKTYWERVEFLKRKRMELLAARCCKPTTDQEVGAKRPNPGESSSEDDDSDESFAVDWRAQHLR